MPQIKNCSPFKSGPEGGEPRPIGPSVSDKYKSMFPPPPKWMPKDMPKLTGKVCLVTGGNTGIGKETCKMLLFQGAFVYLGARSEDKARSAIDDLVRWVVEQPGAADSQEVRSRLKFVKLDLGECKSVKAAAQTILDDQKDGRLDIVFCSAGVMNPPKGSLTADGYEMQWGTNVIGHCFLVMELIPLILSTIAKPDTQKGSVRVVTTTSNGHYLFAPKGGIAWKPNPDGTWTVEGEDKLSPFQLYGQSKTGILAFAYELARRFGDQGLVSIALHPGSIKSELQRHDTSIAAEVVGKIMLYPVEMGCYTQLFAGTAPEAAELNGKYLEPWGRVSHSSVDSQNPEHGPRLWEYIEIESAKHL